MKKLIIFVIIIFNLNILQARFKKLSYKERRILRNNLVVTAKSYFGARTRYDCSGLINKIMLKNNITIFKKQAVIHRGDNGVKIIFNTLRKYHKIFKNYRRLKPGDLIFFDNTYDKNRNNRYDDKFTHIAMVLSVAKDGTVKFIHSSNRGIRIDYLNVRYKHRHTNSKGKILNSFLRRKKRRDSRRIKYLTGELVSYFGTIF